MARQCDGGGGFECLSSGRARLERQRDQIADAVRHRRDFSGPEGILARHQAQIFSQKRRRVGLSSVRAIVATVGLVFACLDAQATTIVAIWTPEKIVISG